MASYYMLGSDGKEYGPVNAEQLRQWANDGRANAQTQVRDTAGGSWMPFAAVPELNPPPPASGAAIPPPAFGGSPAAAYASGPASYAAAATYIPEANDAETVKYLAKTLGASSGWMKFLAVLGFISGAFDILTIQGVIIAWIPIWLGVVVWGAAAKVEQASRSGSLEEMNESLDKIRFSFKLHGIANIVIVTIVLLVAFMAVFAGA